jgi:hypothetical protein
MVQVSPEAVHKTSTGIDDTTVCISTWPVKKYKTNKSTYDNVFKNL